MRGSGGNSSSNGSAFRMAPVSVAIDNDKTPATLTMTRKQSLEALSSRVSDLLEGLDGAGEVGERRQDTQQDVQRKFVQFRQKLETRLCPPTGVSSQDGKEMPDIAQLFEELDDLGSYIEKKHHRHVSSAFMGELVETVQILLKESMPSTVTAEENTGENHGQSTDEANPLVTRIKSHIRKMVNNNAARDLRELQVGLQSVQDEVERLGGHLNRLQQERNDLVHLVSSGQEIMADLVKENESLEQQLTLHIAAQKKTLLGADDVDASDSSTVTPPPPQPPPPQSSHNAPHSARDREHSRSGSCNEDDLLRLVFREKTKAEMLEQQAKHLAIQASVTHKELEELKAHRRELMGALDEAEWLKERDQLLQMLENEKDKVSTWKEEQEELTQQLKAANNAIKLLEEEKEELLKATKETSWHTHRESLMQQSAEAQNKINELTAAYDLSQRHVEELQEAKLLLEKENESVREQLEGGTTWEREKLALNLKLAEKQNRLLELSDENVSIVETVQQLQTQLEEAQAEIEALTAQADEVSWADDRRELMQALEEEIEKRSMWAEERLSQEQQLTALTEENTTLKAENASLSASFDEVAWVKEREELCRALEEEKEKLSSWTEEIEALEEENKELKCVFHVIKDKDLVIRDKEEAIENLNEQLETLQSKLHVQQDEIHQLSAVLQSDPTSWMNEKVQLVNQVAELKLSRTSLEEDFKQETLKNQACLIRIEELEIELDRVQRDMAALKSSTATRKRVSWGSNSMVEVPEHQPMMHAIASLPPPPPPLSININKSHSRFDGGAAAAEASSQLSCHLSVRVPHLRSKSIPPSLQL